MEDPINYFRYWRPTILYVIAHLEKTREYDVEGGRFSIYYAVGEQKYLSPIRLMLGKNVSPRVHTCPDGLKYLLLDVMVRMKTVRYMRNNPHQLLEIRAIRPEGFKPTGIRYLIGVFSNESSVVYFPKKHVVWRGVVNDLVYSVVATPFGEETWLRYVGYDCTYNVPIWQNVYRNHKLFKQ